MHATGTFASICLRVEAERKRGNGDEEQQQEALASGIGEGIRVKGRCAPHMDRHINLAAALETACNFSSTWLLSPFNGRKWLEGRSKAERMPAKQLAARHSVS